jgi:hypothetical protein
MAAGEMTEPALKLEHETEPVVLHLDPAMDVELRHVLLGMTLRRIRDFCVKYDSDANGARLSRDVEQDFASDEPKRFFMVLACHPGPKVVGHLLATRDYYYGQTYCYVHQMEIDKNAGVTMPQEQRVFALVKEWAKEIKALGLRAAAQTPAHVRRLKTLYGFEPQITTMKLDL